MAGGRAVLTWAVLVPERRLEVAERHESGLDARQEREQVPAAREVQRRALDAVLPDQHHLPAAVACRPTTIHQSHTHTPTRPDRAAN